MKLLGYILLLLGGLSMTAYTQNLEPKTIHQIELNLSDNVLNGKVIFKAQKTIQSSQTIGDKAELSHHAQKSITLTEGFHAQEGSVFLASIETEATEVIDEISQENLVKQNKEEVLIYPNPTDGRFNIDLPQETEKHLAQKQIQVVNQKGEIVFSQTITEAKTLNVDLSAQSAGVYIIRIVLANQKTITKKIVIE